MEANCDTLHCVCTVSFLQAQADCFLCQLEYDTQEDDNAPKNEAGVQFTLDGMGATLCQFLGVSNPVFQRRWPGVTVKVSRLIFSLISRQLLLRSSSSSIGIVQVCAEMVNFHWLYWSSFDSSPKNPDCLLGFANRGRACRDGCGPSILCFL